MSKLNPQIVKNYILIFSLCLHIKVPATMATEPAAATATIKTTTTEATAVTDWWQNAIFYQIYPRSFKDSNGDGVGDLKGIISKLPYLAETGITATWLSPIFKSPMVDFGYDIADFKAIQEEYGTMHDFEQLIEEANRLGIKIILDFVPNHTSDQCEWFQKSIERAQEFEDFYIWDDGKTDKNGERMPPNNWPSLFYGSAWTWNTKRQQYYLHQFASAQPDLNYRNPNVVKAMDDVMLFWLEKGVSGFRIDAVNHLFEVPELTDEPLSGKTNDMQSYDYTNHIYTKNLPEVYDMLHHWRSLLDHYTVDHNLPTRVMMTEAYADIKTLMDYYENERGIRSAHIPFNFFLITDLNKNSDARDFAYNVQKWLTYMPRGNGLMANWVLGNHDNPRVASRFGSDMVDAMNMLLLTLPGVAVTYNGEELGMQDYRDISWEDTVDPPARNVGPKKYKEVSRDPERTPFQWNAEKNAGFSTAVKTWLPVHPNYVELNLEQQKTANKSHYKVYKTLVNLRKQMPALQQGRFHAEVLNRDVFAFKRAIKDHDSVITIINVGNREQKINLTEAFELQTKKLKVLVSGINSTYEEGHEINNAGVLTLMPHEGIVCCLHAAAA